MSLTRRTIQYYNDHAEEVFLATAELDLSALRNRFLAELPARGRILDANCGSGRDSRCFQELGYEVNAFDGAENLVRMARRIMGVHAQVLLLESLSAEAQYEGVWACAALIHMTDDEIQRALRRLMRSLRPGGTLFTSFKMGMTQGIEGGRFYNHMTEPRLKELIGDLPNVGDAKLWVSPDVRAALRGQHWLNLLITRSESGPGKA